jgi:transposase-like protein
MRLLVGLLGVAVVLFVFALNEDEETKRCPSCGLNALHSYYISHGRPMHWQCAECGYSPTT